MYFLEMAHHMAGCQSWCRNDPLIFDFSLDQPLFYIGTFSVDILVWERPHKCVIEIGLFACLISANQSFAWQTTIDHFYGMGKYSSQLSLSQKPFLLKFSSGQMMTLHKLMLEDMYVKSILAFSVREH